jgi:hypothetical protein
MLRGIGQTGPVKPIYRAGELLQLIGMCPPKSSVSMIELPSNVVLDLLTMKPASDYVTVEDPGAVEADRLEDNTKSNEQGAVSSTCNLGRDSRTEVA